MLSYKTFCKALDTIKEHHEKEENAYKAGIEFRDDWMNIESTLVKVLSEAMHDDSDFINWWIYDSEFGTDLDISCSYSVNGELRPLPTKKALYEELVREAVGVDE